MTDLLPAAVTTTPAYPMPELTRLLAPLALEEFWQEYWERRPLLIQRDDADYYSDLLTLDAIDEVLTLAGADLNDIRVVVDGKETPVSDLVRGPGRANRANALESLYQRYRAGSTVVINSLQERWPSLSRSASALGAELGVRIQSNIYLTPPGSQGFGVHYDTHDVFVAQVYGSKVWRTTEADYPLPLYNHPNDKSRPGPEPTREFELRSGDLLYLPRGTYHSAAANETASLHVTLGVHPVLASEVLSDGLSRLFDQDVRFRRTLPVGFARDDARRARARQQLGELIDALRELLDPAELTAGAVERTVSMSSPLLRHHLQDLEDMPGLSTDTEVRRRPGVQWLLTVEDGVAGLHFHNKTVRFPAAVADEVRFIAERADWFTEGAIPGELDAPGRRTLVRTLLGEGFLTLR
ncbi:cupin domain-containing protein [Streptomyces sp. HPF1205]|uniref:cupin domain-containing protein n=1 Tax=Streptomyces sp. HPF1205 TaxID=2873262 RepID=UPI001CEC5B20|nr:cupin domain-containing protein [Streptomyces sp. HPF1205]